MEKEIDNLLALLADSFSEGSENGQVIDLFARLLEEKGKQCVANIST